MGSPTQRLREEHTIILRALDALESGAARLAAGTPLPPGWWASLVEWLGAFADRNHHAKEEQSLFPAMVKAGVPSEGGPIAVMLEEHEQGRALIRSMAAGETVESAAVARRYGRLLRDHIEKENGILFPLADTVLDERVLAAVEREFEAVETAQGKTALIGWAEEQVDRLHVALG